MWQAKRFILAILVMLGTYHRAHAQELQSDGLRTVHKFGTNPGKLVMRFFSPLMKPKKRAPLVVALHGCTGSAAQFSGAGFNELADKYHYYVLYPEQTVENHSIKCFNHWLPNNPERGKLEIQSIMQMVHYMQKRYAIDRNRIFIVGFSSGGQMANILAATYPDTFSAGAILGAGGYVCQAGHEGIAGFVYCPGATHIQKALTSREHRKKWPRMSFWHGVDDRNVSYDTMLLGVAQWKRAYGIFSKRATPSEMPGDIVYEAYRNKWGKIILESYTLEHFAHGIPYTDTCGTGGPWFIKSRLCFAREAVRFFGIR